MGRLWRLDGPHEDLWRHREDGVALTDEGFQTVTWSRWTALPDSSRNALKWRGVGVRVAQDLDIEELGPVATAFELIVVHISAFEDGRHFSLVRQLREGFAYEGIVRAAGDLIPDQLIQAHRCGYDEFVLSDCFRERDVTDAFARYSHFYQPDARGRSLIRAARQSTAS